MIITLIIGILILSLAILYTLFLRKPIMSKRTKNDVKADRIIKEIKDSMKVFEFPKTEEPEYVELKAKDNDIIDKTVDIFEGTAKKENSKKRVKKTSSKKIKKK